jgi:hypothetical protein
MGGDTGHSQRPPTRGMGSEMEQYAMVRCPECGGRKRGIVHLNTTTGGRWEKRDCLFCAGAGAVRAHKAERWAEGERMREDRKSRLVTLRDEAKRLGISPSELSRREWGRNTPADAGEKQE